jgi:hypothetical protein
LVLVKTLIELVMAAGSLVIGFGFYGATQPILWPALALAVAVMVTLALPASWREIVLKALKKT